MKHKNDECDDQMLGHITTLWITTMIGLSIIFALIGNYSTDQARQHANTRQEVAELRILTERMAKQLESAMYAETYACSMQVPESGIVDCFRVVKVHG